MRPVDVRYAALPELFDPSGPNAPMVFAVLDGRVPGRALADDPARPTAAVVQTGEGVAACSRGISGAYLEDALARLRADSMVGLVWREDGGPEPPSPAKRVERLDFAPLEPSAPALDGGRAALPEGVEVAPLTPELLERCAWRDSVVQAAGSVERFLEAGVGLCLLAGGDIVAEAYAPYLGRGSAEVGVFTPEAQRGRGYAAVAAAFLGAALAERGVAMYWSCDADNAPSIRVAEKLGFGRPRPFALLLYRAVPSGSGATAPAEARRSGSR